MDRFDVWDGVLLAAAGYVAVIALVRLMAAHRRRVAGELTVQIQAEQRRKQEEELDRKQKEKRKAG